MDYDSNEAEAEHGELRSCFVVVVDAFQKDEERSWWTPLRRSA